MSHATLVDESCHTNRDDLIPVPLSAESYAEECWFDCLTLLHCLPRMRVQQIQRERETKREKEVGGEKGQRDGMKRRERQEKEGRA